MISIVANPFATPPSRPKNAMLCIPLEPDCSNAPHDIGRLATGGKNHQHIPRLAQCPNLSGKNLIESVVISSGGQYAAGFGQSNRSVRSPVFQIPYDELRDQVRGIRCTAAITAGEDLVPRGQAPAR